MEKNLFKILVISFVMCAPFFVHASDLSISPNSSNYNVGDRITLKVMVSGGTPVNAISSNISVPTSIFSIDSISKESSILNFWVTEPSFSNVNGIITFEGVSLGGFTGNTGEVLTLKLRAIKEGVGSIKINSAQILANDGQGTDVTGALRSGTFTVNQAIIKEKEVIPEKKIEINTKKVEETVVEKPQKAPELKAPEIIFVKKFGEQAVAGTSQYPHSQALITFVDSNGYKVFINSATDEKGEFYTLVPKSLKYGVYKITAVVITSDLSNSLKSNELEITIGNMVSDIGAWPIAGASLIFLILLLILVRESFSVKKEKKEAKEILKKSFRVLENDIKNSSLKELKEDLKDAEKVIEKEIKDIGSL